MNKKILVYYPSNKRTNQLETVILEYYKRGFDICLLTTIEKGDLHYELEKNGVKTFSNVVNKNNSILYYILQINYLIKFCKNNNISIVLSNLQHVNFIAVFAQFFIKSKVIVFRHHFKFNKIDSSIKVNKMEVFFDKVINLLAKKIIVPSYSVYNGMKNFEKVNMNKVSIIKYVYNFNNYNKPNKDKVAEIKNKYTAKMRLIMCSRLIPFKRHIIIFPIIKELVNKGYDIKMFVLDEGQEEENLKKYIKQNNLENNIIMLGFINDFLDYMAASDIMIHPSLTEASSSAAKEMAIMSKTIIACKGVGDFDDYIINKENGILLEQHKCSKELKGVLVNMYESKLYIEYGNELKENVVNMFKVSEENFKPYLNILTGV